MPGRAMTRICPLTLWVTHFGFMLLFCFIAATVYMLGLHWVCSWVILGVTLGLHLRLIVAILIAIIAYLTLFAVDRVLSSIVVETSAAGFTHASSAAQLMQCANACV